MERRKYPNPPIEEALCELRFFPGQEWDLTIPGHFHEKIRKRYPGKPRQKDALQAGLHAKEQAPELTFHIAQAVPKIQFPSDDDTRLIAIAPDILSIHILRPYSEWEDFKARIQEALGTYIETVNPKGIARIGVRYINRINIKKDVLKLPEYFVSALNPPEQLPVTMTGFFSRIEHRYKDKPVKLVQTFASAVAPEGISSFILDLDVIAEYSEKPLPLDNAMDCVEDLRKRERVAFESHITDKTRETFDNE